MYLGVDIGTTGTKAILVDDNGAVIGTEYCAYPTYRDHEGYFEQNANDWWQALVITVRGCTRDVENKEDIRAMALSTQAGTVVLTDIEGNPLAKAITWQDSRAGAIAEKLNRKYGQERFYFKTGWRLSGGFNFLIILWLKENCPDLFSKANKFLSVNEFINYKLTGSYCGDFVNAGISQLFDIQNCVYSREALEILELPESKFAELLLSGTTIGSLTTKAAVDLGLTESTKVVLAGQDQYCAALGMGAFQEGDIALSTGTAWVLLAISSEPLFHNESFIAPGRHICQGMWGNMATLTTGGSSIEWYRDLFKAYGYTYQDINRLARSSSLGANGLMLLPFFQGATCPIWDNSLRATLFGLELRHGQSDIVRAIMEGVSMQMKLILETIQGIGFDPRILKAAGGAMKSLEWAQIIADVMNTPLELSKTTDMACIGAALVAAKENGVFSTYSDGINKWVKKKKLVLPNKENVVIYQDLFEKYKRRTYLLKEMYA